MSTQSNAQPAASQFRVPEKLCLLLYAAVVLWLVPHHEPWTDEAQGWLIARSCSLPHALGRVLHYEVAPALWQFTLYPLVKLHLPFRSANWFSACLGIASAYLLLRYSPFPRILRCLLPFTFFLQYQYAIVARPYAYFPPLLFGLCVLFRRQRPRPLLFALLAGLVANISLHCTVYAAVLFAVYLIGTCWTPKPSLEGLGTKACTQKQRLAALAIFGSALAFAVVIAFPAPDQFMKPPVHQITSLAARFIPPEKSPAGFTPDAQSGSTETSAPASQSTHRSAGRLLRRVGLMLGGAGEAALFSISRYNLLAVAFLALYTMWVIQRRMPSQLLPIAGLLLAYMILPVWPYHTGLFFVAVVASLWMAWPRGDVSGSPWLFPALTATWAAIILLQIGWAAKADWDDLRGPSDPAKETADFLQANFSGKRLAAFSYETETLGLYMPFRPPGWQHPFWSWSRLSTPDSYKQSILATHPDVVVVVRATYGDRTIAGQTGPNAEGQIMGGDNPSNWWESNGWRVTHHFCGKHFGYGGYADQYCSLVLEPPAK